MCSSVRQSLLCQTDLYAINLQDQFDTIDFSDNEIRKLDGFPLLLRLKNVITNNNRIWLVATVALFDIIIV